MSSSKAFAGVQVGLSVLFVCALVGCSSAGASSGQGRGAITAPATRPSSAEADSGAAGALDVSGDWVFCYSEAPETDGYTRWGGRALRLSMQGATLIAQGLNLENEPTWVLVRGPFDAATRSWSANFLFGSGAAPRGSVLMSIRFTFNGEGTHFDGTGPTPINDDPTSVWYGKRVDGTSTCENQ
jgi:hypothetical protein